MNLQSLSLQFEPSIPAGEAVIHFDSDGRVTLYWGGENCEENLRKWSAGNITSAYAFLKLTEGVEVAESFMRAVGGTDREVIH